MRKANVINYVNKTGRFDLRAMLFLAVLLLLVLFELNGGRNYLDEALCIAAAGYLLYLAFVDTLSRYDSVSIFLLVFVVFIGLLSNVASNISVSAFSIAIDIIAEIKVPLIFFAAKYLLRSEKTRSDIVRILFPVAKVYIVVAFVCSVASQFVDIGMAESERYGLMGFKFFFPFSFQFLAVTLVMIAILISHENVKHKNAYLCLASISLMLALKSSPLLFGVMFLFLLIYFNRRDRLKMSTIVIMCVVILLLGSFQIQTYLLNPNAPRALFFHYGAITANEFFPLGSGFSTFGSDQAARNYSPLYYQYGFNTLFGMNPEDGSFLSDTFWPTAIAQFGWIGFAIYVIVFLRILRSFAVISPSKPDSKAFVYSAFASYMIHAVGSAILSASAGVIGFVAIAFVLADNEVFQTYVSDCPRTGSSKLVRQEKRLKIRGV